MAPEDQADPANDKLSPPRADSQEAGEAATLDSPSGAGPTTPLPKASPSTSSESDKEEGEASPADPPLPKESLPDGPPLPNEPAPVPEDDGWDCRWDPNTQSWFFYNRFTGNTQWENPRVPDAGATSVAPGVALSEPQPPTLEQPAAGGYNPAIHGNYDPNAWYAKGNTKEEDGPSGVAAGAMSDSLGAVARFNRFTGQFQSEEMGPDRHTDEAKSRRQMNAFFDVDAAANSHDGRSLKAERSNKKPSKSELKAFKEKRRAKKEEKRRAWLRD